MAPGQITETDRDRLAELRAATVKVGQAEQRLAERRAEQRALIRALYGEVGTSRIAAAAGITRQHVLRLVANEQREV